MSTKEKARHFLALQRRKPPRKPGRKHGSAKKVRSAVVEEEILEFVRTGVESFILKNATVEDFYKTIRAMTESESIYAHQLTKSVFSRIVKEAIRKRNHGGRK